jgi:hypothetical protein
MELLGTHFNLTLGSWRLRFLLAIDNVEEEPAPVVSPHHIRVVKPRTFSARN